MKRSSVRHFSTFAVNPETSAPPHGSPRGTINRFVKIGLPPWAAWCGKLNRYSMYRMSVAVPRYIRPKSEGEMDQIWMNEQVRERVRTSPQVQNVYKQLKYPWMKTGIWHSAALDHWVQVPHVMAAHYAIEREGGFDNFILNRPGHELQSKYGERIRRHILVRQEEIRKNFVLHQQATHLAATIEAELAAANGRDEVAAVVEKYGLAPNLLERLADFVVARRRQEELDAAAEYRAAEAAAAAAEGRSAVRAQDGDEEDEEEDGGGEGEDDTAEESLEEAGDDGRGADSADSPKQP